MSDAEALKRFVAYRSDPWKFLCECVFTRDEVDSEHPIKLYPGNDPDFAYLKFLVAMWIKHKKLGIPKSRRMTVSWTFIALALWECIFFKGKFWAFTSKKEEDAKELVERAEFIYKHIPPDKIPPELLPKLKRGEMQTSPPVMDFEGIYSKIQGFPQGGNQLRQRGCSGILEDECAFQEESEDTYVAAEPTIKGGGRMIKVSSRATVDGGFFKKVCFDQLDATDIRFPEIPPVRVKSPMEGVEVWTNPKNEFTIVDLHYTANPKKRGAEFREGLRRTLPVRKFLMEYEKSWQTYEGKPVYEDFNALLHVTQVEPKIQVGLPLLIGWDSSGLTPAAVLAQLQGERLVVIKEIVEMGMGAKRFVPFVAQWIRLNLPQCADLERQTISFFDPAGFKKNEITEETYLAELIKGGFKQIRPGAMTWKKRVEGVVELLIGLSRGDSKILIYEKGCPILTAACKGGFRYPEGISDAEPDKLKPIKDIHSHPSDALQYLCSGLKSYKESDYTQGEVPTPTYGFQKDQHTTDSNDRPTLRKRYG